MSNRQKPTILHKQLVASSRLFNVEQMDLEFSNGEQRQYERLVSRGNGAVMIAPMLDVETVLLIREYCGGTERYELGLPKGKVEAGEDVCEAANREIMEEVGYKAASLKVIKELSLSPQYMQHRTHLVLAQDLTPEKAEGDEPEELEVVPCRLSDIEGLMLQHDMTEARSLAALFMVRSLLRND